ncbi:MAG: T9SS type A sorting domain-containing protein [Saprospiraceae bacterium]|nr:T9SS type A sorting domain-containing protein [Saprospiraceae bacterium]MBP7680216.1 T9SS type A sorting domain-containing protein [Saprospiraceae bacterium]
MKKILAFFVFVAISVMSYGQNLISNWQFQYPNMQPRCDGWFDNCGAELTTHCDTNLYCFVGLINQSPSVIPEDIWSLKVITGFPQEGFAETYISGQSGTNIYELKFWMKATDWYGGAKIGINTQNQFATSKTLIDTAAFWKQFTLIDTLTTQSSDTITVRLTAGSGDDCICPPINFAFVELNKIAVAAADDPNKLDNIISTYPNPTNNKMTIEVLSEKNNLTLDIYNAIGQHVARKQTSGNIFTIDKSEIGNGLFFYQLHISTDQKIVGRGRIVFE